jgi:hypothetical protein
MLYKRGGVWTWRRAVPAALRSIIEKREVVRSLRTSEVQVARSRAITIAAETDAAFWRARRTLANPASAVSAVASQIVREDADWRRGRLLDDDEIEAQQLGITDELERLSEKPKATKPSDEIERQGRIRALRTILAKLEAGDNAADAAPDQDDVTLSGLFDRYRAERKPSEKVWREFDLVQRHCIKVVWRSERVEHHQEPHPKPQGASADVAKLEEASGAGRRRYVEHEHRGEALGPGALRARMGEREGFVDVNPAHGTARVASTEKKVAAEDQEQKAPAIHR